MHSDNWPKRLKNYADEVDEGYRKLQDTGCRLQVAGGTGYKLQATVFVKLL